MILRARPLFWPARPRCRGQGRKISRTRPLFWPARPSQDFADKAAFVTCKARISRTRPLFWPGRRFRGQGRFSGLQGQDFGDKAAFLACKAKMSRTRPLFWLARPRFRGQGRFSGLQGQDVADKAALANFADKAVFLAGRSTSMLFSRQNPRSSGQGPRIGLCL